MTTVDKHVILQNTSLASTPLIPELKVHLATNAATLWEMTEAEMQSRNAKHKSPTTFLVVRMGRRTSSSTLHSTQSKLGEKNCIGYWCR